MGSFYSTCSVSGMTLASQPVVRLLLLPQHSGDTYDTRDILRGKGLIVSNEGACAAFVPFGFPIRGDYYDYGQLENVVEDDGTRMLEEFFGTTIETIMEMASDDRWMTYGREEGRTDDMWRKEHEGMKNVKLLELMTYTDIRADIYDYLAGTDKPLPADVPTEPTNYNFYGQQRWQKWRDRYFMICDMYAKGKLDPEGNVTDDDDDENPLDDPDFSLIYKAAEAMDEETRNRLRRKLHQSKLRMQHYETSQNCFIRSFGAENMFLSLQPWIRREHEAVIYGMRRFLIQLEEINKVLMPSVYGSQDDNFTALIAFNEKVLEVVRADKKARDEEYAKYRLEDGDDEEETEESAE